MAGLTGFLTSVLGPVLRPIIKEEIEKGIKSLTDYLVKQQKRLEIYEKYDREADDLIEAGLNATTTEETKAQLRRLKASRARIPR